MKTLRLLIIPLAAFILGTFALINAARTVKRIDQVEEQPTAIACEQLIANGPPKNRHVTITDCRFAEEELVCELNDDRDAWRYVLIPIYPTNVQQAEKEQELGLVACIRVSNFDELEEFLDKPDVVGCVWDEYRGSWYFDTLLRDLHPNLEAGSYRVVFLGEELPTMAQVKRELKVGAIAIGFGVCFLFWMVWKYRRKQQRNKNQEWFAKETPVQPVQTPSFDPIFTQFEQPSEWMASIRSWTLRISAPAFMIAGCFYFLSEAEIVSEEVGTWGMMAGVFTGLACSGIVLWIHRYYTEQTYKSISSDSLPRAAKAYFEQETPRLESLGFVYLGDIHVIETISASVRLFLSDCGECLVTLESGLGQTAYNFLSVAKDGTLLHTVSLNLQRSVDTPLPSRCQWTEATDLPVAFRQHMELMVSHVSQTRAACLTIDPEFVTGVMDYAHRISGWSDLERGSTKKRLPSLPRAEQMVRAERGRLNFAWQARPNGVVFANERLEALRTAQASYAARSVSYAKQSAEQEEYFPLGSEIHAETAR